MPELVCFAGDRDAWLAAHRSIRRQHKLIAAALIRLGATTRAARLSLLSQAAGRQVPAFADLGFTEATAVLIRLGILLGRQASVSNGKAGSGE